MNFGIINKTSDGFLYSAHRTMHTNFCVPARIEKHGEKEECLMVFCDSEGGYRVNTNGSLWVVKEYTPLPKKKLKEIL